jgi:hypothetical protein
VKISDEERRARLAERHRLLPRTRTDDLARIADDLVALHSTDPVTVYLSAMARMANPSIAAVEQALYTDRTLIRHHAMRRTLWLATPEVARMIHAAATRKLVAPERARLVKALVASGIDDPDTWLDDARRQVLDYLDRNGPTPARDVGRDVPALRRPLTLGSGRWVTTLSAHTRVLLLLGFEGQVLRGPPLGTWVSGAYAYASARSWLPGGLGDLDELPAATELVRRWLRGFGPGTTNDVAWWFGWTKSLTNRALEGAGAVEVDLPDGPGWVAADDPPTPELEPWVAMLPALDPTTMGWKQRSWYLPEAAAEAFDSVGNGGPTLWVDGRIVGAWAQTPDGVIHTHYFERVAADRRKEIDDRIAEVAAMIGDTRFTVRFPGDVHARLIG